MSKIYLFTQKGKSALTMETFGQSVPANIGIYVFLKLAIDPLFSVQVGKTETIKISIGEDFGTVM